jgi:hypothetical protein
MATLMPMLADFALRLSGGLAAMLLVTPWRQVPPKFFQTHSQVLMALAVLAALDMARAGPTSAVAGAAALAALGYVSAVAWGLGLPRVGLPADAAAVIAAGSLLAWASMGGDPTLSALDVAGRISSALLLGSTLTAMLLGHYYLTAPSMSIAPLERAVAWAAGALGVRTLLAALGLGLYVSGRAGAPTADASGLFLAIRWGMGVAGPILAMTLAWKTTRMRSTQSATGILYIAMTLVLFGELTALILSRRAGVLL